MITQNPKELKKIILIVILMLILIAIIVPLAMSLFSDSLKGAYRAESGFVVDPSSATLPRELQADVLKWVPGLIELRGLPTGGLSKGNVISIFAGGSSRELAEAAAIEAAKISMEILRTHGFQSTIIMDGRNGHEYSMLHDSSIAELWKQLK